MAIEVQSRQDQLAEMKRLNKNTKKVVNFVQDTIDNRIKDIIYLARYMLVTIGRDQSSFIGAKPKLIRLGEVGGWRYKKAVTALKMMQVTSEKCSLLDARRDVLKQLALIK